MKKLHNKVNVVPVIAKSDVLTKKEIQKLKKRVTIIISELKTLQLYLKYRQVYLYDIIPVLDKYIFKNYI